MLTPEELQEISRYYAGCTWDPSKESAPVKPESDAIKIELLLTNGRIAKVYFDSFNDHAYVYSIG